MKRIIALFLFVMMLCTAMVPLQSFAEEDQGLEKAISSVRQKIDIPEDFTFNKNFDVSTERDGRKVWSLSWKSKDEMKGEIYVRVDDRGTIYSYNYSKPYDYNNRKRLPNKTREEALKSADAFIKKVNPDVVSHLRLKENFNTSLMDYGYFFEYTRIENGIPFNENNVNVTVDRDSCEVLNYYLNWTNDLVFPSVENAISSTEAQAAYKEKLGLKLIYKYSYEDEKLNIYPVYVPMYSDAYAIDALTGEKTEVGYPYYGYDYGGAGGYEMKMARSQAETPAPNITPEEREAIEEASKIISEDEAVAAAKGFKPLADILSNLKLGGSWLSRSWLDKSEFTWGLQFIKEATETDKETRTISVTVNAVTREIKSFYLNPPYDEKSEPRFDKEQSKAAVDNFLNEFYTDKVNNTEYDEMSADDRIYYPASSEKPRQFYFTYVRKVNGIPFPNNYLRVGYDAVSGQVFNLEMEWFNSAEFPAVSQSISSDKAYETLFGKVGIELQYKAKYSNDYYTKPITEDRSSQPEIKLVYAIKTDKPRFFDPATGIILDYDGKPYKEIKPVKYTDIAGHYAEDKIKVLAEFGIALEEGEFRPDESITQKHFLTLLVKTINYYDPYILAYGDKQEENLYNLLIREGIVKQSEKAPDANLTREESVKFIIRALKYDKVADIKGIFNCTFEDKSKINPDLVGYIAIAQGLEIVKGNNGVFNPKAQLTRAQAAIIIYNYLQI